MKFMYDENLLCAFGTNKGVFYGILGLEMRGFCGLSSGSELDARFL